MKRSFAHIAALLVLVILAGSFLGCGRKWPFAWQASEQTRQAQALVEDNLDKAEPHTAPAGKPHVREAKWAARVVTSYVGKPEVRQLPTSGKSAAAITQAEKDVARPAPTMRDVARALPTEVEESIMPWVDIGIDILGIAGFPAVAAIALRLRKKGKEVIDAFEQTVEGIDAAELEDAEKAKLHTALAKSQDRASKKLVTKAKTKVT